MSAANLPSSSSQVSGLSPQVSGSPLHAAFSNALAESSALPTDIQYMPPGRHRIRASQGGQPVSVEVAVSAATGGVRARLEWSDAGKLAADGRTQTDAGTGARVIVAQSLESGAVDELIEAVLFRHLTLT